MLFYEFNEDANTVNDSCVIHLKTVLPICWKGNISSINCVHAVHWLRTQGLRRECLVNDSRCSLRIRFVKNPVLKFSYIRCTSIYMHPSWITKLPTTWTSEGTLERKSRSSLLSIMYGSRSFLVNLFTPAEKTTVWGLAETKQSKLRLSHHGSLHDINTTTLRQDLQDLFGNHQIKLLWSSPM